VTTGTDAGPLVASVLDTVRRHGMLRGGETVLVALSGGADSVALTDVLAALAVSLSLRLHAVHVHHGLRGADADRDADFSRALAAQLGLPFHLERVALPAPGERGSAWEGLEGEARRVRHAALVARATALGAGRIATGHTADDQAETVLMRLLQGAGPRGLGGIAPVRGAYVRPLLECRRAAIEAHLAARGLTWVEDATNRDPAFLRNRIRHDLLPFLAARWDADVVAALGRGAAVARALVDDLERVAETALDRLADGDAAALVIDVPALRALPGDLAAEVLRRAALRMSPRGPALRAAAERALRRVLAEPAPRRPVRLGRVRIERSGRRLRVGGPHAPAPVADRAWDVPGRLALPEIGRALEARELAAAPGYRPPRDPAVVAFDADHLPARLAVRARRAGDRFTPFGGPGVRRLKSFLIDAGVPRWERARVPLLEAGGEIVWVVGLRRGGAAPVTADTRRILEVTVREM
jgi:tRNA(Ile)-lysidine synthase